MKFITKEQESEIVKAIEAAELKTSGEIRVHIESKCPGDAVQRAIAIFNYLKMYKTKERNGVLIYVACNSHKFAIIGDKGINEKVSADFWNEIKNEMRNSFVMGDFAGGICNAVHSAGESLARFFPYRSDDVNEQPNEVSFGD